MKIKNISIAVVVLCIAGVITAVAGDLSKADKLRAQASSLYKNGQADKALVMWQQAKNEYQAFLNENPNNTNAVRGLAMTLFDLGEYKKSNLLFRKAGVNVKVKNFDSLEIISNKVENTVVTKSGNGNITNAVINSEQVTNAANAIATSSNNISTVVSDDTTNAEKKVAANTVEEKVKLAPTPEIIRGIELQPNLIYSDMPEIMNQNIKDFVARSVAMKVNSVFIDAFVKVDANGSYRAAYFKNSVMPVRADLLTSLSSALAEKNIAVFAVMPVLSFYLKDNSKNNSMLVMSRLGSSIVPSRSWRRRISPFSTNGIVMVNQIYSDLAENVPLNGIVFDDDAYLTDREDLNPDALAVYSNKLGITDVVLSRLTPQQRQDIAKIRVEQLEVFCGSLILTVREKQPNMKFINTLYSSVVTYPPSESWLSQNYKDSLLLYDKVMVLADPELAYTKRHSSWFRKLRDAVLLVPDGKEKTIFRLSNYSTMEKSWVSVGSQAKIVRMLSKAGMHNFVLSPDDFRDDRPRLKKIKRLFEE